MSILLNSIQSPADLKKFKMEELSLLCHEIRDVIINTTSSSGGHLGSSLGAVELIVGLHYCLNAPEDSIIFDVGHQAYAHKLLTGRKDNFHTLRQLNGISGFPNKYESEYDVFTTGHGSASISTALGMVMARNIEQRSNRIVAVIGDASLGGGMAFEALNHAGHLNKKMLVILNDNEMSISKSVGALSRYLNRIITAPSYNKIRKDVERLLKRVPRLGFRVIRAAKRLEEGLKKLLVPGMIFEELGFRYFGPIDGNNIKIVTSTLKNIIDMDEPVLLHVITKKGKGYSYAEEVPEKFHGVGSFDIATGEKAGKKEYSPSTGFTETFKNVIVEEAKTNEKIVAITAAMPEGTGLGKFAKTFPDRFFDVGMAEQHAVGFAAGLAKGGLKPVAAIYSTFLQRSYDQIIHDVCLQNLNVILMLDRGGLVGEDGATHHGVFDISYIRNLPNMTAMAPKDETELKEMFRFALSYNGGPVSIRYPRGKSHFFKDMDIEKLRTNIEMGRSEILKEGKDLTILGLGYSSLPCLEAAHMLSKEGIECEVINARFIKPLDVDVILKSIIKTKRIITVEEGVLNGGFGSYIYESLIDKLPKGIIIKSIGIPDRFIEHGDRNTLLDICGLSVNKIKDTAREHYGKNRNK